MYKIDSSLHSRAQTGMQKILS
jgi:phage terminase small subunit